MNQKTVPEITGTVFFVFAQNIQPASGIQAGFQANLQEAMKSVGVLSTRPE
jgi:hypothetical protein